VSQHNLTINITSPEAARISEELLLVEQADWKPFTGYVTKGNMVRRIANMLYGDAYQAEIDCGMVGSQVVAAIYVYPLRDNVRYRLVATHGVLSDGQFEASEQEETLHFSLETTASIRYPAARILSAEWLSSYDADGNATTKPSVTAIGREVTASGPVYGSLRIRYIANRFDHILTMDKREDAVENWYSAAIVALPSGGRPVFLTFDPPPTAEEMAKGDYGCGMGSNGGTATTVKHPLDEPEASRHQRFVQVDYCTQTILVDSTI